MAEENLFFDLVPLCDRIGLPLIVVRDDIRRHFEDSPHRQRILRNLEAIRAAIVSIPRDYSKVRHGQGNAVSHFKYEWPKTGIRS